MIAKIFDKRERQAASIPKEWLLADLPPVDQHNVIDFPRTCGLLCEQELKITETNDVSAILKNLSIGTWSAIDVTTAFCKRAIVAHQLVSFTFFSQRGGMTEAGSQDELPHGDLD